MTTPVLGWENETVSVDTVPTFAAPDSTRSSPVTATSRRETAVAPAGDTDNCPGTSADVAIATMPPGDSSAVAVPRSCAEVPGGNDAANDGEALCDGATA